MKKAIYKFHSDWGRMGYLEGVLISTKDRVEKLIESKIEVYFGEVFGKHSEVYGIIRKDNMTFISDNEEAVRVIEEYGLTSGINPFQYTSINFEMEGEDLDDMIIDEIIDKLL